MAEMHMAPKRTLTSDDDERKKSGAKAFRSQGMKNEPRKISILITHFLFATLSDLLY